MTKRGPNRNKVDYSLPELYKAYIKGLADKESKYNVKRGQYGDVLRDLNEAVAKLIVEDNFELRIPSRLGTKRVKKTKQVLKTDEEGNLITRGLAVDFKATLEMWAEDPEAKAEKRKIYHLNEHTGGYKHKWFWSKKICNAPNKKVYQFIASRDHKRFLGKELKTNDKIDFYE